MDLPGARRLCARSRPPRKLGKCAGDSRRARGRRGGGGTGATFARRCSVAVHMRPSGRRFGHAVRRREGHHPRERPVHGRELPCPVDLSRRRCGVRDRHLADRQHHCVRKGPAPVCRTPQSEDHSRHLASGPEGHRGPDGVARLHSRQERRPDRGKNREQVIPVVELAPSAPERTRPVACAFRRSRSPTHRLRAGAAVPWRGDHSRG